jgi:Arc/MetJ-type ribon-helix-helix transcriptional regulator
MRKLIGSLSRTDWIVLSMIPGAAVISIWLSIPSGPVDPLTRSEREMIPRLVRDGAFKDAAEAERELIAARPSEEEMRRFRYEREQKQKDIAAVQASLCEQQPYLDRCR